MDISRTMHKKRRAVRKLVESFPKDEGEKNGFKFPPPPYFFDCGSKRSTDSSDTSSDKSTIPEEAIKISCPRKTCGHGYRSDGSPPCRLPPVGVFWDIENCQIPHGKSAVLVVQAIRERFFKEFREAEFIVVCDVKKESPQIIQELNDAQVNLIHVPSTSKNAADEKLRQSMRRFADIHEFPAAIILISGDINFASDLSDLRHRKKLHVILLHNSACSIALILCANEHYNFDQFVMPLPSRGMTKQNWKTGPMEVMIWNLPRGCSVGKLRERLKFLSYNCGGRISFISDSVAVMRFPSFDLATRAHKRMNGEVMYGNQIGVSYPQKAGTLKKENTSSKGQLESSFYSNGKVNSISDQNGSNLLFGSETNHFKSLFRSTSHQESTTENSSIILPTDLPWLWDATNGTTSSSSANNFIAQAFEKKTVEDTQMRIEKLNSGNSLTKENGKFNSTNQNNRLDVVLRQRDSSLNRDLEVSRSSSKNNGAIRKSRTPSPYLVNPKASVAQNPSRKSFPSESTDSERYFNPIQANFPTASSAPIELHITNLDQTIEPMEMRKILLQIFGEHVMVLHVSVFMQSDGNFAASIKVPSIQDAQYAISQLHRRKIGYKRIMISYAHSTQPHNPQFVRWQIVSLLREVPGFKLPLFKFLKLFESRYVTTISLSDLYRLKDVCCITDESTGRMVSLNADHRNSPSPNFTSPQDVEPYCSLHYHVRNSFGKGWAEQEVPPLPNVNVPLKEFSSATVRLIATHNNALPLSSFVDCYEAECGELPVSENGVPLEHFVTCVNKVELAIANGVKYLRPSSSRNFLDDRTEDVSKCVSPSLVNQLVLFGRELVDLLRTQHHCQLIFNRLIPAYHHHFGRQCRVADYGFTKLIELLEAIPNIAQVIGEGNKRVVTLSHRAQMKRFTSDLLRALKAQPNKKLTFEELPQVFERVLGKQFYPADYGLCTLSDLIDHVPESTVVVQRGEITTLSIPKREQTNDEVERTKQFSKELDEDSEGERRVTLTQKQKLFVVGEQICDIVIPTYPPGLPLDNLAPTFLWQYGYALKPQTYELNSLSDLIDALDTVRMENSEFGGVVVPVEEALIRQLMTQVRKYLIHSEGGKMKLSKLSSYFSSFHATHLTPSSLTANLPDTVCITVEGGEEVIQLTDTYQVGRRLVHILNNNNGHMSLNALEAAYSRDGGGGLAGHPSLASILAVLPSVATVKGKTFKRHVILNKDLVIKKDSNFGGKAICRPSSTSFLPSQTEKLDDSPTPAWHLPNSVPIVNLPEMEALPENLLETASSMISPCKGLLPPSARPPHPSQLPIPIYLSPDLKKNGFFGRDLCSEESKNQDSSSTPYGKRKFRLAAQFQTPLDLN